MEIAVQKKLQALEKRQVEVEAELNHDRTSLTQTAVKVEADLRTQLATTKTKAATGSRMFRAKIPTNDYDKNKYRIVTTNTRSRNPIYERAENFGAKTQFCNRNLSKPSVLFTMIWKLQTHTPMRWKQMPLK